MGRGEEFTKRKQNKAVRKRMRSDAGDVNPEETAAAKRRRRKGVRRIMEGMCYTIPTVENPFNEPELRNAHKMTSLQKGTKIAGRNRAQASKETAARTAKGKANGKLNGEGNGTGVRRAFWPLGADGKAALSGPMDRRLPLAFQSAFEAVVAGMGIEGSGAEGFRDRVLGGSQEWEGFLTECWEGCLRGQDVLAVVPPDGTDTNRSQGVSSGETNRGASTEKDDPHQPEQERLLNGTDDTSVGAGLEAQKRPKKGSSKQNKDNPKKSNHDPRADANSTPQQPSSLNPKPRPGSDSPQSLNLSPNSPLTPSPNDGNLTPQLNPNSGLNPSTTRNPTQSPGTQGQVAGLACALGYILPGAVHVSAQSPAQVGKGPVALIVVESKARVMAVRQLLKPLREAMEIRSLGLHEGTDLGRQMQGLEAQAAEIMVGTAGRLWGLIERGALDDLSRVSFLVVECSEAMLESTTSRHLSQIRAIVPSKCHSVFLSAGYPPSVCQLAREWLQDPICRVGSRQSEAASCACIDLQVAVCKEEHRLAKVLQFVKAIQEDEVEQRVKSRVLLLVQSRGGLELLRGAVDADRHKAVRFSSSFSAEAQGKIAEAFRSGKATTLVMAASDLPSLDVKLGSVPILVFADFPASVPKYMAAVASIARRTTKGQAFCVLTPEQATLAPPLVAFLEACGQPCSPNLAMLAKAVQVVRGSTGA